MVRKAYISSTNCVTPVGFDVVENFAAITRNISAIRLYEDSSLLSVPFHAAMIDEKELDLRFARVSSSGEYTKLEKMLILALKPVVERFVQRPNERTGFILSTTKGNITELANSVSPAEVFLSSLAKKVADYFAFESQPMVVSNACVSGIQAVAVAKRLIETNMYDHIFVAAGDLVSRFVLSGFQSFQAMSADPCKPFSKDRSGVTLGEAAAAILVTVDPENAKIAVSGAGSCNDANHISGPSRTGEGLVRSVESALKEAEMDAGQLDYISAHGTATLYNDEMEAVAINRLGLKDVPVNSFKGVYGHTLGASGLLEAVMGIESMMGNRLLPSFGYSESGVSQSINVIEQIEEKQINSFLKTASGFGGCNTAVVFEKLNNGS